MVDSAGAAVVASTITSSGASAAVDVAGGTFSIDVSAATTTGKSVFCVAEDAVANVGAVVETMPTKSTPNLAALGIVVAALFVAAGFVFAFYWHGSGSADALPT